MPNNFKIFGVFNVIDLIIILIVLITLSAIFFVCTGKMVKTPQSDVKTKTVEIDIMFRGEKVSRKGDVFKAGDKTFITIRNVPYTKVDIIKTQTTPELVTIPDPFNPKKAIAVEDPAFPNTYNYIVTISDNAVITKDGVVAGGNKVKIGLPITLEGFDYRLSGLVSDVRIKENTPE